MNLDFAACDNHAELDPVGRHDGSIDGVFELLGELVGAARERDYTAHRQTILHRAGADRRTGDRA